jgi:outer membrane biosynthesis protein TonB
VKLPEMKTGLTISALAHLALLVWGLVSFAGKPLEAKPTDALPIDIISDKQFSEMTKGVKNAPKDQPLAPLAEKVGDKKTVDDSSAKVTEKKVLDAAKTDAPPPPPAAEPQKAEAKPDKKEPPKETKVDPIAETLKKEEAKKKAEDKAKAKAVAQQKPQPAFDPNKIAALLDKREPTRQASAAQEQSQTPSLGKADGQSAQLSQSEIDALRKRLGECWNPPAGATNGGALKVVLRVLFKPDATVATPPQLVAATASEFGPAMAESAKRAILTCQPFTMLRAEHYQQWKDIEITFDPREMFGG